MMMIIIMKDFIIALLDFFVSFTDQLINHPSRKEGLNIDE